MSAPTIQSLLGKRCLLKISKGYGSEISEFKIIEISPSGNWIKIQNLHGQKIWKAITDISFVEELMDLKNERKKETGG